MRDRIFFFLSLLFALTVSAADSEKDKVRVGMLEKHFVEVSVTDAKAALTLWIENLVADQEFEADLNVFPDSSDLYRALFSQSLDLIAVCGYHYAEFPGREKLTPIFANVISGTSFFRSVLLVRESSGITKLEDLKGCTLTVLPGSYGKINRLWLETELLSRGMGRISSFFSSIENVDNASRAALPVFFGQSDACLITEDEFNILIELNPQMSEKLTKLIISVPFIRDTTFYTPYCSKEKREAIDETFHDLHEKEVGRQIMTLFKVEKLAPVPENGFDSIIDLYKRHKKLIRGLEK